MRALAERVGRSGLLPAVGANAATQLALAVAQLAVVPAFALRWGPTAYGVWLMLFALPSYLAMADLGLAAAAGNDMTAAVARGERAAAVAAFQAVRAITLLTGALALATVAVLPLIAPHLLDGLAAAMGARPQAVLLPLTFYGVLGLQNGVTAAGMRATGGYAAAGFIAAGGFLAEAGAALLLLAAGRGMVAVACGYLAVRAATSAALAGALAVRARWLVGLRWRSSRAVLRRLLGPAAAAMALPLAQAASIQGTVLAIGWTLGSAAVPAFTAVRTLSRVAIQAILLVNHALMPTMTVAAARSDAPEVARCVRLSYRTALALALPGALGLMLLGRPLVLLWTHGALRPGPGLLTAMAAVLVANALWQPASNLVLAINRHERFSWFYLLAALGALALCVPLARGLGPAGAAVSLLVADVLMLWRIAAVSRALGLPDLRDTVRAAARWRTRPPLSAGA